jgi:hypothetical protein
MMLALAGMMLTYDDMMIKTYANCDSRPSLHMARSSPGEFNARPTTFPPIVQKEDLGQGQNPPRNGEVLSSRDVSRVSLSSSAGSSAQSLHAGPHEQTVSVDDDDGLVDVLATTTFNDASGADMGYFGSCSHLPVRPATA